MKKKIRNIIISVIVFIMCVLLNYVFTDIGFSKNLMYVSGIPFWIGSLVFCIGIPIGVYFTLEDK